mgnify:CR=1 FL=1
MPRFRIYLTGLRPAPARPTPNSVEVDSRSLNTAIHRVASEWSVKIGRKIHPNEISGEEIPSKPSHRREHPTTYLERSLPKRDR